MALARALVGGSARSGLRPRLGHELFRAARDLPSSRAFYAAAFGWALTDFGPSYSCPLTGDVDLGLQGDVHEAPAAPLAVVAVDDL